MDIETLLNRAQSALAKSTTYKSPGSVPSLAASSWPTSGAATDCSGFVTWCLRISRQTDHPFYVRQNGGWFDTAAVYADGEASVGFFDKLDKPKPGSMLVYPDYVSGDGEHHDGHIGIVLDANGGRGVEAVTRIVHCSFGASNALGDAVQATPPTVWLNHDHSSCVWYTELTN